MTVTLPQTPDGLQHRHCAATGPPPEDPGATLPGFAKILSETAPNVFGTVDHILDIFKRADEEFCNDRALWLSPVCTYDDRCTCWAVDHQRGWNTLFNHRGVELLQQHHGTLYFRTFDVDPDDLPREGDVKFICIYLWLLRQHRCIMGVTLSISVLAPRHQTLFASLLKFTEYVEKCEIRGCDPLSSPSVNEQPRVSALDSLSALTELGLTSMHLSTEDSALLPRLIEKNVALTYLILIEVQIEASAFAELITKVVQHKQLMNFRLKMAINEPVQVFTDALSLLGMASLHRLHIDVDCNLLPLLKGLVGNDSLIDLTIEATIVDIETLTALADISYKNVALQRMKAKVDLGKFLQMRGAQQELFRIAGSSKLHTLVLSGSTLTSQVMSSLADGVAVSRLLKELHLDDCNLSCVDVRPFIRVLSAPRNGLEELNVGSLKGNEQERRELLKHMMDAEVCHKITCVYDDSQIELLEDALFANVAFSKICLSYGSSTEVDPVLRAIRSTLKTLKSLSIITQRPISNLGGQFLAYILRHGKALKVVRLRCRTRLSSSIQILKGLAESKSVAVVTIERWDLGGNVPRIFVDTLRQNRSIRRLEFYWNEPSDYTRFKEALVKGLRLNTSVSTLKMYQGPQRDEVYDRDLLRHLHKNEMILSWTLDVIFRDDMTLEGAVALDVLKDCDATLDLFKCEIDFSPRTVMNRRRAALMSTRSAFYALLDSFGSRPGFVPTPEGREQFENLVYFVREDVEDALRLERRLTASL